MRPSFRPFPSGTHSLFQSTHPLRDATRRGNGGPERVVDFNPRIPCGMRPAALHSVFSTLAAISIYASLAGCDLNLHPRLAEPSAGISIHASLAGCDCFWPGPDGTCIYFNPRIPCGMRRSMRQCSPAAVCHFNPRIPCGMRLVPAYRQPASVYFNPRIPCGMRLPLFTPSTMTRIFQSTHPLRDATSRLHERCPVHPHRISIHASLAGCDSISE